MQCNKINWPLHSKMEGIRHMTRSRVREVITNPVFQVAAVGAALGAGGILFSYRHISTKGLEASSADPALDYAAAIEKFSQLQARDDDTINVVCRSQLLTHGSSTQRAIVLLHGLTNCPRQYDEFAARLYEQGYNVLIPRIPHNGLADRMTDDLKYLKAEELRAFSDTIVDIAHGLGEQIVVVGLSAGAVIAAWIAQQRPDVARAVLIAPSLGFATLGPRIRLNAFAMNLLLRLPNILTQDIRPFEDGPDYAYLGYSTHALGEVMRLGLAAYRAAVKRKPAVQSILLVTNANDNAVSNFMTWILITQWRTIGLERLEVYEFKKEYGLIHDVIDPRQRQQRIDLVYPILLDLIEKSIQQLVDGH
jgi:pimeloyl-ACP methyl ester carboxylesterase